MLASTSARQVELNTGFRRQRNHDYFERMRDLDDKVYETIINSPIQDFSPWFPSSGLTIINFLPFLRCDVMYTVGEKSDFSSPWILDRRLKDTGTGFGGSGGAVKGRVHQHIVHQHIVKGSGHYDIFDAKRSKEVVSVSKEHLVQVHATFQDKLKAQKNWQKLDPKVQQLADPEFLKILEAWRPQKIPLVTKFKKPKAKL